ETRQQFRIADLGSGEAALSDNRRQKAMDSKTSNIQHRTLNIEGLRGRASGGDMRHYAARGGFSSSPGQKRMFFKLSSINLYKLCWVSGFLRVEGLFLSMCYTFDPSFGRAALLGGLVRPAGRPYRHQAVPPLFGA
ncbi:MAG TPA: hypothetical protein VFB55_05295, partial [Verrucomicrobiae bacterium]|nr:hypothetical protein [Verrucomicrobiae bacterium]